MNKKYSNKQMNIFINVTMSFLGPNLGQQQQTGKQDKVEVDNHLNHHSPTPHQNAEMGTQFSPKRKQIEGNPNQPFFPKPLIEKGYKL